MDRYSPSATSSTKVKLAAKSPGRNFSAREVAEAIKGAVPGAVIELGPGTLPWTTHTALRGPLAGERLRQDTGYEVGHSLEDGIRAYADWLRARPELYR